MRDFRQLLESNRAHVFDGAMGTMIYSRGVYINRSFDELNLSSPDLILAIHREYIRAGAEIIETNTYGANGVKLAGYGFETRVAEAARADGFDGHICGHIHYGRIAERDGFVYINDGDWVEHCTALVEHADGAFELLHWTERQRTLAVQRGGEGGDNELPLPVAA